MHTVVIIEDEDLIRQELLIAVDWESIDCRVIGDASDGISGESLIRALHPDVVLSDIRLPGQSGLQMIERAAPRSAIILTGYGEFELAQQAIRLGVYDYLMKPADHEDLLAAVRKLCRKLDEQAGPAPQEPSVQQHTVRQAMDYIDGHYHEDISIYQVASHLQLSESHLSHQFKEFSGYTVLEYLQNRRIREAMKLLRETTLQVSEIYRRCGFLSGSYFSRLFKRYTGVTPRDYRSGNTPVS